MAERIVVAGGGSWGTALAHALACAGHEATILLRDEETAAHIREHHENPRYLAGKKLHFLVGAATGEKVLENCSLLVLAVPCQKQRGFLEAVRPLLPRGCVVVNAAKGLERGTCLPLSRVAAEALPGVGSRYAVLSGPSLAAEVMGGLPTAVVLGCADESIAELLRDVFSTPFFRCYSNADITGVETGGALKNVMAIAAGVCDGLGFGHNSRAGLITRGLAELKRIGTKLGADPATFMGLSGLGDLVLTCTGDLSRNRQVGLRLGRGESLEEIILSLGMVAEGVETARATKDLAHKLGVDAPVTRAVCAIIDGETAPHDAVAELMSRPLRRE
ncbi:MAG: NAD(P)-dependent glycerol-3-phosphate dehydrogenase [Mailhella sp.]|nr:NAD(P)-dependent glycerol-3-phosphate dehydrogenase [Mailhella sp.]